jgi:hypothetical protein
MCDAIEHQHGGQRQLRIAWSKQAAMTALEEFFPGKAGTLFYFCIACLCHGLTLTF